MAGTDFAGAELTVDLDAIAANHRVLRARLGKAECGAVVKANAYGLGVGPVARALAAAGCRRFFISSVDEGIELRRALEDAGAVIFIYVLTGLPEGGGGACAEFGLTPVLGSLAQIDAWTGLCRGRGIEAPAAVKIDTGMSRLGLDGAEVEALAADPARLTGMTLDLLMSHFACADDPKDPMNERQRGAFEAALKRLPRARASLVNSAGVFLGPGYHYDLARPGSALYGVSPHTGEPNPMRQVASLRGKILQLRDVDTHMTVGYGAEHRMERPGTLATVAVGYADGYLRSLGGRGTAFVDNTRVSVVGRISMDLTVFDVTDVPTGRLRPGDYIDLIGERHTVDDLAAEAGTIGYEILTSLGHRYRRTYLGGE